MNTAENQECQEEQGPGIELCVGLAEQLGEAFEGNASVLIAEEDGASLDVTGNDVVKRGGVVKPGATWHAVLNIAQEIYMSSIALPLPAYQLA